jgi:tetratricopeptide (TPR) repeat protein
MRSDSTDGSAAQKELDAAQLPAKLRQAFALHQQGQLLGAQTLYVEILRTQPLHFDALHLLGMVALQSGDAGRAAELIGKALDVDPNNAAACSNRGLALSALNQPEAALASYERAITIKPDYAAAYLNRANTLIALRRWDAALSSCNRALAIRADYSEAYCSRGVALQGLQRLDAALASFEQAIALKPDYPSAYCNRANVLLALQRWGAALASCDQAIALKGELAEAHSNRGSALRELGQLNAALASCDQAIALKGELAEAHCNRGNALRDLRQLEAALASYDQAIALKADFVEAYSNRGDVLRNLRQLEAALASCDRAIALDPDYAAAYCNRGNVLVEFKQLEAALISFDRAIAIRPNYGEAYSNRGSVLRDLQQLDAALASCDQAIALKADYAEAYFSRSLTLLLSGDLVNGWLEYEWRWKSEGAAPFKSGSLSKTRRSFAQPLWLGEESLTGKTILLYSEQGLGDTLQFCRYASWVARLGARVILEVQRPLVGLLAGLEGVSQWVARGDALPEFDYQCPLLSLPLAFKTSLDSIPSSSRYLSSEAGKVAQWRARLGEHSRPRVGLVWSGRPAHLNDHNRSIALAELIPHLPAEFQYVSLQKDVRETDQPTLRSHPAILDFRQELKDFSDTAALCDCMDVVISVDTSVAHLSGALGKRTWILLPFTPDWRWLLDRTDSPWYPTVKLYRQEVIGDWNRTLAQVGADLIQTFPSSRAGGGR